MKNMENPKAPHNQPFNIKGRKSLKTNSWFCAGSSSYWRAKKK